MDHADLITRSAYRALNDHDGWRGSAWTEEHEAVFHACRALGNWRMACVEDRREFDNGEGREMTDTTAEVHEPMTVTPELYGDGPWVGESNRIRWRHLGLPCLMLRQMSLGHWCGYVAVPADHNWHGETFDYADAPSVRVHGGITYAGPLTGEPDGTWWIGFDTAHAHDICPKWAEEELGVSDAAVYRDVLYVQAEVEHLAQQVRGVER